MAVLGRERVLSPGVSEWVRWRSLSRGSLTVYPTASCIYFIPAILGNLNNKNCHVWSKLYIIIKILVEPNKYKAATSSSGSQARKNKGELCECPQFHNSSSCLDSASSRPPAARPCPLPLALLGGGGGRDLSHPLGGSKLGQSPEHIACFQSQRHSMS